MCTPRPATQYRTPRQEGNSFAQLDRCLVEDCAPKRRPGTGTVRHRHGKRVEIIFDVRDARVTVLEQIAHPRASTR